MRTMIDFHKWSESLQDDKSSHGYECFSSHGCQVDDHPIVRYSFILHDCVMS